MDKETRSPSSTQSRYQNARTMANVELIKPQKEKSDKTIKVETRKNFSVNELYAKLLSLGQIHDLNFRNQTFHGDRKTCIEALNFAQKAPQYMSAHDFYLNAKKIEKMTAEIQSETDSLKRQRLLQEKLNELQDQQQKQQTQTQTQGEKNE